MISPCPCPLAKGARQAGVGVCEPVFPIKKARPHLRQAGDGGCVCACFPKPTSQACRPVSPLPSHAACPCPLYPVDQTVWRFSAPVPVLPNKKASPSKAKTQPGDLSLPLSPCQGSQAGWTWRVQARLPNQESQASPSGECRQVLGGMLSRVVRQGTQGDRLTRPGCPVWVRGTGANNHGLVVYSAWDPVFPSKKASPSRSKQRCGGQPSSCVSGEEQRGEGVVPGVWVRGQGAQVRGRDEMASLAAVSPGRS